jgi:hypothetical protein
MRMTAFDDEVPAERRPLLPSEHAVAATTTVAPIARTAQNMDAKTDDVHFRPSIAKTGSGDRQTKRSLRTRVVGHLFQAITA